MLLHLQDELQELQNDLESLDAFDEKKDLLRLQSRRRDESLANSQVPGSVKRRDILNSMEEKMERYGNKSKTLTHKPFITLIFSQTSS